MAGNAKTKAAGKYSCEHDVIASDRVELARQANDLVGHMVALRVIPDVPGAELNADEYAAYKSALGYLQRQFEAGHRDAETYKKREERE